MARDTSASATYAYTSKKKKAAGTSVKVIRPTSKGGPPLVGDLFGAPTTEGGDGLELLVVTCCWDKTENALKSEAFETIRD